jgi:Asp-tRNA(Asn)/Glu-tRNA(Gln) amidotransferase A subunit family amidase
MDSASNDEAVFSLSAAQAVRAIRTGELPARSYVVALLNRARYVAHLNALIEVDERGALERAAVIDDIIRSGKTPPPLAGLPIVVKDNINSASLPATGGTLALKNFRPEKNAPALQALLDAGAIPIAKANLHELGFGITSTNLAPFAGPVRNPYDPKLIAGGSSGGTGAAISARIVPAGLSTDCGGSIRIPAALTGTVGFRPSVGNGGSQRRYNSSGIQSISHTRDTIGVMARTVEDVAMIDAILSGSDTVRPGLLSGLRLGVPPCYWRGLDREVEAVMMHARMKLSQAGITLVDIDLPGLTELNAMSAGPIVSHEPLFDIQAYLSANGAGTISLGSILNQISSPDVREAFRSMKQSFSKDAYSAAVNVYRPQLQALYADYFSNHQIDAIFSPTVPVPAIPVDLGRGTGEVSINGAAPVHAFAVYIQNTDPGSNPGIPGISLPAGMTANGLPIGMSLDGPLGSDEKLLAIGMALEILVGSVPAPRIGRHL